MRSNLSGSVRSGSYVPGVTRLRPLSESECYTRLYGDREIDGLRDPGVRARPSRAVGCSASSSCKLFEEELDDGPDELPEVEAA